MFSRIVLALALLSLPVLVTAKDARLDLPSFKHLQDKAVDCVDISIGRWPIGLASALIDDDDAEDATLKELLHGIKAIYVRSYKFAADDVYSKRDVEAVREQLRSPQWTQLAQVRKNGRETNLDVYVSMQGEEPTGLAIVAMGPREFTILNVVGRVSAKNLGRIERQFGLPTLAAD